MAIVVLLLLPGGSGEAAAPVATDELEAVLERDISETAGTGVEAVDCPGESVQSRSGAAVKCTLRLADGQTATAEVTFTDSAGNFGYEIPAGQFRRERPGG